MAQILSTNDLSYICLHEAGHAAATYYEGGSVEFIELLSVGARTNVNRPFGAERGIACGGFAVEYLLYKANRLVNLDQTPLDEKTFIGNSMNNAIVDKVSFFGANYIQANGIWPEQMDREFMDFAIKNVSPNLLADFVKIEELAEVLESSGRVERKEIERILGISDDFHVLVKSPKKCILKELDAFETLVREGNEVTALGLRQRIEQAEKLVFIYEGDCVAVGAIKNPNEDYKTGIFASAGVPESSNKFSYELGWLYVTPSSRGKGLGRKLMVAVSELIGDSSCYATTRENNDSMHHLFSEFSFNKLGSVYQSENGYSLALYANRR